MASVILTKDEFVDYLVAFLLDKMYKKDEILPNNEAFNNLMKKFKDRGMDNILLNYYINSNPEVRNKYKASRKSFKPGNKDMLTLSLKGGVEKEKKTKSTMKTIVKRALKMISAQKRRRGFPLNEKRVDIIIERVMYEEGFLMEDDKE